MQIFDGLGQQPQEDEFASASGKYFDNDSGRFASPHPDALDQRKSEAVKQMIEAVLRQIKT